MMNFTTNDLLLKDRIAEREREAKAVAGAPRLTAARSLEHHVLRAALAAKLARLALRIDRETAGTLVAREARTSTRHG